MKLVLLLLVGVLLGSGAAMAWQQRRYLRARRELAQDRQPLLHDPRAFHVVTFLRVAPGADVIEEVGKLRAATRSFPGVRWVYAGEVILTGEVSEQIGPVDWSAVVLVQYPSREAYDRASDSETCRQALARFPETYSHGLERSPWLNLLVPQLLLGRRVWQLVSRQPSPFPFLPAPGIDANARIGEAVRRLLADRELTARAAVVVNLQKRGTPAQQASDRRYVGRMLAAMAEGGYGPIHIGRAVRVEADHDFDTVAIVSYPSVRFVADMIRSRFFQSIIGDKQLGDTQATITVPILDRL